MGMDNYEVLQERIVSLLQSGEWENALTILQEGDATGDSNATCLLGDMYYHGVGVMQDSERAVDLFEKALNLGNPKRAYTLGSIYEWGKEGIVEDKRKAFHFYSKGAELGDPESMGSVAFCYMHGRGTDEDCKKALSYGLQAAKLGDYDGMLTTATCYNDGLGTHPDAYAAAHWYRELIQIDNEPSNFMFRLSLCLADPFEYFNIRPTQDMLEEAFHWASKAVEAGHVQAHLVIAWFYEEGNIVNRDYETSYKFLTIAAENGDEIAPDLLKRYRKNIYGQIFIPQ